VTIQDVLNSHAYEIVIVFCGKCMETAAGYMTAILPTIINVTLNFEGVGHEDFINSLFFRLHLLI
jgi:hypothetical protein